MTESDARLSEAALREAVQDAFADRTYPGDDRIAESDPRYESYEGHASERFEERMSGLSTAEVEAVRRVLEHLAERVEAKNAPFQAELPNGPQEALESWGQLKTG